MFKLKYNLIAALILALQLVSLVLIYNKFGASDISDVLMVSLSIVSAIQLVQIMPIDQFMIYFHRSEIHDRATEFWQYSLTVAIGIGLISCVAVEFIIFLSPIIFNLEIWNKYKETANILKYSLLFYPTLFLNDKILNGRQYIIASYILSSITHLFILISLVILILTDSSNSEAVAWGYTVGVWLGAIISTYSISVIFSMPIKLNINAADKWKFHSKSIQMRLGHNLVAVFFPIITNYYLAKMPAGVASLFHYAHRGVVALYSISAGPPFKFYMSKISQLWAIGDMSNSKIIGRQFAYNAIYIYLFTIVLAYGLILIIEDTTYLSGKLAEFQIEQFKNIFLLIALWHAIILYESRYVGVLIASDSSKEFICVNAVFVATYMVIAHSFFQRGGVYAICMGAVFTQAINALLYSAMAKRKFKSNF